MQSCVVGFTKIMIFCNHFNLSLITLAINHLSIFFSFLCVVDRYKVLAESNAVQEKEGRLGTLINILDERDSKLRQLQGTLKEQMEQWQRSISDLQVVK